LGVPVLVYLFLLSGLPLYLVAMIGAGRSPGSIVGGLAIDLAQITVWFTTSLLFAACFPKGGAAKAITSAMAVSVGLLTAGLITTNSPLGWMFDLMRLLSPSLGLAGDLPSGRSVYPLAYSQHYLQGNADWVWFGWPIGISMLGLSLFAVGVLGSWSYACWLALVRRFDRPSSTLWSKGQIYGITAVVTTIVLGSVNLKSSFGIGDDEHFIHSQMPLCWLLLPLALSLIQSRQVLLDWVRHPVAPASRKMAYLRDLIWGESSPPWVAFGIQIAIVALIISSYNLLQVYALKNTVLYEQLGWNFLLFGLLINFGLLLVGLSQLIQLRIRRWAGALTTVTVVVGVLALPIGLRFFFQDRADNLLLWPMFYPLRLLYYGNMLGVTIAILAVEYLGVALIYRQFNRSLRNLSKSNFAQVLEPRNSSTNPEQSLVS
jgi:hypothetical protein